MTAKRDITEKLTGVTWRSLMRPRVIIYGLVLGSLTAIWLSSLIWLRQPFKVDVIRDRGGLGSVIEQSFVENTYRLQIMNVTEQDEHYTLDVSGLPGLRIASYAEFEVPATESRSVAVRLRGPLSGMAAGSQQIIFHITAKSSGTQVDERSVFLRPL